MADYTMGEFIADVKDIQAAQSDPKEILQRVAPLAKKIADDKAWLNDSHYRVEQSVGIGITIIHEETGGLQVATVCWPPEIRVAAIENTRTDSRDDRRVGQMSQPEHFRERFADIRGPQRAVEVR